MPNERSPAALEASFKARLGGEALGEAARDFIAQAARDWAKDELSALKVDEVAALAEDLWRFANEVAGQGPQVRIRRNKSRIGRLDLIEVVQDDRPFILASVMAEIAARGLVVEAMAHPVVEIAGKLRSTIQVAIRPARDHATIRKGITEVVEEVVGATEDFSRMTERFAGSIKELEKSGEGSAEDLAFLKWLDAGRFVFLGARRYDYPAKGQPIPCSGSGLGVLRDPSRFVLRNSDEPSVRAAMRRQVESLGPVTMAKSNLKSRVHRRVHMDYVGLKRFENGKAVGEDRFVGLLTAEAYILPVAQTPMIREKAAAVFEAAHLGASAHAAARLRTILEDWPRDDLFQISHEALLEGAMQALHLQDRPRVDLFVRLDPFDRFASIMVYLPRERFDYDLVQDAGEILAQAFKGRVSAVYPSFGDAPLARIHFIIGFTPGKHPAPDTDTLRRKLCVLAQSYDDLVAEAARKRGASDEDADALAARAMGFSPTYQAVNTAADALDDLAVAEGLSKDNPLIAKVFRRSGDPGKRLRLKLYAVKAATALADVVPVLEHMGLKAIREDSFGLTHGRSRVFIDEYLLEDRAGRSLDIDDVGAPLEGAFVAIWTCVTESDGFNRLVIDLGVNWRDAALIRALARYRQQSGLDPSQMVQEQALADYPAIANLILDLFRVRFDPAIVADVIARQELAKVMFEQIEEALGSVTSLDADRALRRIAELVQSVVRTNFYQLADNGAPKPYIAFKVASRALVELPAPKPFREIFISSPQVDGVHLRLGPVARGGLRWSDRRDDFRTEVLALVKAQQVKNAVIVPVGSKGGFFPKRLPRGGAPEAIRAEGVAAYTTFVTALLDLTDNIGVDGKIIPPVGVVVHDPEDPYLVVAADKGTATFSDIANGVAEDHDFWLGDAFASGGSVGYDHKAMGITARGAWEAVKRHFRELGKDIQAEPFTAMGVGDMSGDVFGNGMLLSRQTRLLAAFDHRHIFFDPDPDPAASFAERERLFALPRSSWDDYDKTLISAGGGVFPRSAKSVALTEEVKAMLDLKVDETTPQELISAILKARVELLYLGGIGTYVKALTQANAEVGDKANDAVRVNGAELRCKVVGEGANLGFTQAGRIEFAMAGGRINTDAIDNSAGVDCSDHEVNIKILLRMAERAGKLDRPARNVLLAEMTDEVGAHVLSHNYDQTLALSLMEADAVIDLDAQEQFMVELEAKGRLDRPVEGLPSPKVVEARAKGGRGLTRPELAVLLAYGKLDLFDQIIASEAPDDPHFHAVLTGYFPQALGRFDAEMRRHRLKREIIATVIGNEMANLCGPTFPGRLQRAVGCSTACLVTAFAAGRIIIDFNRLWMAVEALDGKGPAAGQLALFRELAQILRGQTFWLARRPAARPSNVRDTIKAYYAPLAHMREEGLEILSAFDRKAAAKRADAFVRAGAPRALAVEIAAMRTMIPAIDLVDLANNAGWPATNVLRIFHQLGGLLGYDRLRAAAVDLRPADPFERTAVRRLIEEMIAEQVALTAHILTFAANPQAGDSVKAARTTVASWTSLNRTVVKIAQDALTEVESAEGDWTFAKLTIANAALRHLLAEPV